MSEKKKKIILIILFLAVAVFFAWLIYIIFFKPKPPVAPPEIKPPVVEEIPRLPVTREAWERMTVEQRAKLGLPTEQWAEEVEVPVVPPPVVKVPEIDEIAAGGRTWINPVSDVKTRAATLSSDGRSSVYYDETDGHFYKIDENGEKELMTDQVFYNVEKINWSPTKDKAVLEYPDGFKTVYDFVMKKQYVLPRNWEDFSFNPSGTQIAFKSTSKYPENNWLATANYDGTGAKPIEHMGENADKGMVSSSPNYQTIAFSQTGEPRGTWVQSILLIGFHGENFRPIVVDGRGFEPAWAPKGDKITYSVYSMDNDYKPRLYLVNAQGDEIGSGKIDTGLNTWAHKCSFNKTSDTLYCAVPEDLPEGAGMMPELATGTKDKFYKIDVATGETFLLAEGAMGGYDVEILYPSDDEDLLYFIDKETGILRYIKLK